MAARRWTRSSACRRRAKRSTARSSTASPRRRCFPANCRPTRRRSSRATRSPCRSRQRLALRALSPAADGAGSARAANPARSRAAVPDRGPPGMSPALRGPAPFGSTTSASRSTTRLGPRRPPRSSSRSTSRFPPRPRRPASTRRNGRSRRRRIRASSPAGASASGASFGRASRAWPRSPSASGRRT